MRPMPIGNNNSAQSKHLLWPEYKNYYFIFDLFLLARKSK